MKIQKRKIILLLGLAILFEGILGVKNVNANKKIEEIKQETKKTVDKEKNIARNVRIDDNLKKLIDEEVYRELNFIEKEIMKFSFMNKKITVADLSKNINKTTVTTRMYLKKLVTLGLLEWHGTNSKDPTQFYSLKK